MFISKGFNGKVFKISNLPPKFKLTRMATTQKFYWFLLLYSHHVGHGKNDDETRKFPIRKRVKCLGEISSERERERKMHKYATCNLTEYLLEFVFTFQQIESLIMQKLYIESWNIASMVHNYEKYRMGKVLENCSLCIKSIYYL